LEIFPKCCRVRDESLDKLVRRLERYQSNPRNEVIHANRDSPNHSHPRPDRVRSLGCFSRLGNSRIDRSPLCRACSQSRHGADSSGDLRGERSGLARSHRVISRGARTQSRQAEVRRNRRNRFGWPWERRARAGRIDLSEVSLWLVVTGQERRDERLGDVP